MKRGNKMNQAKGKLSITQVAIETLESRQMLSHTIAMGSGGLLVVNGTKKADKISITMDKRHSTSIDVTVDGKTSVIKESKVAKIYVNGAAGNDTIMEDASVTIPTTLLGGTGNDTIVAGGGNDVIDGGTGTDQCDFHHNSGIAFDQAPAAVQTGLTTLAQGATITNVQVFNEDGQTYYGTLVALNSVNTRLVVDSNGTPVTTGQDDNHGGGDHHDGSFASLTSIDTNANTISVMIGSEHRPPTAQVFSVTDTTTVTVDGTASTLAALPTGAWIHLQFSPTDPTTVTAIQAFGKRVGGTFVSADANTSTIVITDHRTGNNDSYTLDANVTVTLDGNSGMLSSLTAGMDLRLKFSADNTKVVDIFANSVPNGPGGGDNGNGGNNGGPGGNGGGPGNGGPEGRDF